MKTVRNQVSTQGGARRKQPVLYWKPVLVAGLVYLLLTGGFVLIARQVSAMGHGARGGKKGAKASQAEGSVSESSARTSTALQARSSIPHLIPEGSGAPPAVPETVPVAMLDKP